MCVRPSPKHLSLDSSFVYRQMSKITKEAVVFVLVFKLCLTPCNPMDHSLPDSSVHGISQERMLEWVAIPFSRGSSQPRDGTQVSRIASRLLTVTKSHSCDLHGLQPPRLLHPWDSPGKNTGVGSHFLLPEETSGLQSMGS